MIQYLVIQLDDTATSFCHYDNPKTEPRLIPLATLKAAILYAMTENLNIQFVFPSYQLPKEYDKMIASVDHVKIKPATCAEEAEVVVFNDIEVLKAALTDFSKDTIYALRTDKQTLFNKVDSMLSVLYKVERLNIVITDIESFTEENFKTYASTLQTLANEVEKVYVAGKAVQLNLLTDRMMLNKMNNCGAGETSITLAPDGKYYVCPAFYLSDNGYAIGDLEHGLNIKNPQLYKLDHAPLCRNCEAYQCKRCIWLNRKTTLEVNTPGHEQCVVAHLERNASRKLLQAIRKHGEFLPEMENIKEITYLDPFDVRKEW
jgi:CXXX repeat peptide maturase